MAEFDENVQAVAEESTATETTETTETVDNTASESQEDASTIPPELEGIDDDEIVKEVMAEAKGIPVEELEKKEEPADPAAPSAIPYVRFKEKVDEGKAKDAEIAELKKQIEAFKKQQAPQYQAPTPQAPPVPQPQQGVQAPFQLNKENIDLINRAINEQAQAMAQLSKEDMDSLEYMEDDDPRKQRWEYAKEMARGNIFSRIREAQQAKLAQAQRFMQAHQQSVNDFNAYAQQASQEPDFEQVKDFAINEFFTNLPSQRDKEIITQAYARVEQNVASPEDMYLIKNYYAQAKAAYRANASAKPQKQTKNEQVTFPRSGQVNGAGDAGGGVTIASLEKMLNEMPFDEIDPKYQKMLLGE